MIEGPGSKYKLAFSCGSLIQPALFISVTEAWGWEVRIEKAGIHITVAGAGHGKWPVL